MKVGLLIICFRRPNHTERVFKSIISSDFDLTELKIFIAIDGPRNKEDKIQIEKVKKISTLYFGNHKNKEIYIKDKNIGLKKNVLTSINESFKSVDGLIVLEDDITLEPNALKSAKNLLEKYNEDNLIGNINLFNEKLTKNNLIYSDEFENQYKIDRSFTCWGWATWKDKWRNPKFNKSDLNKLNFFERLKFNSYGRTNHLSHLYSNIINERNTWAVLRKFDLQINMKLKSITFYKSQVNNFGFDGTGSHHIKKVKSQKLYKLNNLIKSFLMIILPSYLGLKLIYFTHKFRRSSK